jgi:hypothetical protein
LNDGGILLKSRLLYHSEGTVPELKKGDNEISFSGEGSGEVNARVQVTVISEGEPLAVK